MKKLMKSCVFLVISLALIAGAVGCSSGSTSTTTTSDPNAAVKAYADPAAELILQGLSEDNLAKYVQNGEDQFKAAVTQAVLDSVAKPLKAQYGDYVSKSFLSVSQAQGYTIVIYNAKFSKGTLKVQISFDADQKVAGQFFP
jgi:hypothetical protein